jgi:general secretion pathway protein D
VPSAAVGWQRAVPQPLLRAVNEEGILMNFVRITCAVSLGVAGFVLTAHAADAPPVSPSALPPVPEAKLFRGDDQVMRAPAPTKPVTGAANSFKFEEAPISDVAHLVLRDIMKVDYVLHQPLLGSVTMSTSGSVPADQAVHLLETALQANGLLLARDARGVYHVGKPESLRAVVSLPRQANASGPLAPGYGPLIISPRFVGASELANILRPILPADAVMRVDTVRNLLVLVGTRAQVEGWLDIANTFDVDLLKGMSVGVFPLKYATVKEVEAALQLMASASGATPPGRPAGSTAAATGSVPNPANPTGAPTGTAASRAAAAAQAVVTLPESFPLYGAIRVLPIERMNSVIIVTPRAAYLEEARKWIERLDQPGYSAGESQLFVYRVQNGSARHLADVLNGVFGGTSATASTPTSGVAPGLTPTQGSTGLGGARTATTTSAGPTQNRSVTAATFASGVRVVADEINNSVLIYGSLSEYRKIESTLKRLDIAPTQVMIEASIVEVTLNDTLKYGLQWAFSDSRSNGDTGRGVLSSVAGGALGGALAGFSYTVTDSARNVRAVLNALADKSLIKVISSPSLMVLDNHTASIVVGDQQPIRTSTTVTDGGVQTNSIQYKDTGVALTVTPSVNAGNIVTMNVSQSVTDIGPVDEGVTDQRSFLQRQVTSKVAVRSGEAIVLGGLIRDNDTRSRSGVPLLQDVPVFGGLFGTTNNSGRRTELLVVITPRVVRTDVDASAVGEELRDRMAGVRRMMEEGARDGAVLAPEPPLTPSGTDPVQ